MWHVYSYDKLYPFGLFRYMIWLNVFHIRSNPRVIYGYYMEGVGELARCPQLVRGDMGTENGHLARMQTLIYGQNNVLYGASMNKHRIGSFLYVLRMECAQCWMDTLKPLKDRGDFTGDEIDIKLMQFCFSNLLQVRQWLHIQYECKAVSPF